MYDIIIVGAGIAGLTSAIYALQANKKVLILEKDNYGGQIIKSSSVNNYPGFLNISGYDLATNIYQQVKEFNGEIKYEEVKDITENKEVITNKAKYQAKAIIIATGLIPRNLEINGEKQFLGKGVSYCATCDGNFYKNKDVMVVGGGNTAIEEALYLSNLCHKVYLIHRRDEFRAAESSLEQLKTKENVEIICNSKVNKIYGNEFLEGVEIIDKENNIKDISISGLFIAIGKNPNNYSLAKVLELTDDGYISSSENCHTNIEGVFVAGDIRQKKLRQLVTAASDGAIAATEAIFYINKNKK